MILSLAGLSLKAVPEHIQEVFPSALVVAPNPQEGAN